MARGGERWNDADGHANSNADAFYALHPSSCSLDMYISKATEAMA